MREVLDAKIEGENRHGDIEADRDRSHGGFPGLWGRYVTLPPMQVPRAHLRTRQEWKGPQKTLPMPWMQAQGALVLWCLR
jgi:hypothetical protein